MTPVNINTKAKVTLTALGAVSYNAWANESPVLRACDDVVEGAVLELPLWEIMQIFGSRIYHGMVGVPFLNNSIELEAV